MRRPIEYEDFEIQVTLESGDYFAQVLRSPAGESSRLKFSLPFNPTHALLQLENAILRSVRAVRSNLVRGELREIGESLFKSLLADANEIRDLYIGSQNRVSERSHRLRVKLCVADTVGGLPWEYFYDNLVVMNFLALHAHTSLVRYVRMPRPVSGLKIKGPLRILGMAANPRRSRNFEALDVVKERSNIDAAIAQLHVAGSVHFQFVRGESYDELLHQITHNGPWHVFHFIGHGGVSNDGGRDEGYIVLAGEAGEPVRLSAAKLQTLLVHEATLRLVVLNCCDSARGSSSVASALVNAGIPAVLAMQFPISDSAAIDLASAFYAALADGEPVDGAVTRARILMQKNSNTEWGVPVLYMRASDGQIFEMDFGGSSSAGSPEEGLREAGSVARRAADSFQDLEQNMLAHTVCAVAIPEEELGALSEAQLNALIDASNSMRDELLEPRFRRQLARLYYELGSRHQKENSLNKAFVNISAAIEFDAQEPKYFYDRANIFARSEQFLAATADMDRAIALAPERGDPHWAKGVIFLLAARKFSDKERLRIAVGSFTTAIKCAPGDAKYYSSRGAAYILQGRMQEALLDLEAALRLDPNDGKNFYQRGLFRLRTSDKAGAIEDLRKAMEMGYALAATDLQQLQQLQQPTESRP